MHSSDAFLAACARGDEAAVRAALDADPALLDRRAPDGATALHRAWRHPGVVRLLLTRGADPNARETGDNALPLHFATSGAPIESVRALLDAGADVHGAGDAHALEVIGWAACFGDPRRDVIALLLRRGARHHVFSATAVGDHAALRALAAADPEALRRRLSVHEQEQTALHYCIAPADGLLGGTFRTGDHYRTLELLIELGADLDARDARHRTPLAVAMLRGDREAMRLLHAAGAREPESLSTGPGAPTPRVDGRSVSRLVPMIAVEDVAAAVAWYRAVGFELAESHGEGDSLDWAEVTLGAARVMLARPGQPSGAGRAGLRLWLYTSDIDALYEVLSRRQFAVARAWLAGRAHATPEIRFQSDLHTTFYGMREFAIGDPYGVTLTFAQPVDGAFGG
jgi:ankyrin repeat protein